jgi:hypothetical protein
MEEMWGWVCESGIPQTRGVKDMKKIVFKGHYEGHISFGVFLWDYSELPIIIIYKF